MHSPPNTPSPESEKPVVASKPAAVHTSVSRQRIKQGILFQLGVIIGVAVLLATLYTAWTPGQYRDESIEPIRSTAYIVAPTTTLPNAPTASPNSSPIIGIVAGHWKNDSGAVCPDGLREVDINLNIATLVQKILEGKGYEVDLLKEFDYKLFNYQAAALVSIHNDSCDFINDEATGFKVASAMGNRHPEQAARLTACLRNRYAQVTDKPLHSTSVTPDMTSYHAFGEINENTPAAIIETGFMNLDRDFLTQHPEIAAQGIVAGIICFIENEEITLPTTPTTTISVLPTNQPTNP